MRFDLNEKERQLLQGALYEYINARTCPRVKDYITKRYPVETHGAEWCAMKQRDVEKNLDIATAMRARLFGEEYSPKEFMDSLCESYSFKGIPVERITATVAPSGKSVLVFVDGKQVHEQPLYEFDADKFAMMKL